MRRRVIAGLAAAALAGALAWIALYGLPPWLSGGRRAPAAPIAVTPTEAADRRIRATLYYVAENGTNLVAVDREVPFGEAPVEQAQRLVEAQLQPVAAPLLQPIPEGVSLRSIFITAKGEAYVDMSPEISTHHPGGSLDELFTVYALVNVLTVNLPAIVSVQILVDGHEVETIAGHVDLRRPLVKNLSLLAQPEPPATQP